MNIKYTHIEGIMIHNETDYVIQRIMNIKRTHIEAVSLSEIEGIMMHP